MAKTKKWTITVVADMDGTHIDRINDGFNVIELLGLLSIMHEDILAQLRGEISPVITKRTNIED